MKAMCRFIFAFSLAFVVSVHAAQFKIGAHNFTLPDGFESELVAGTNLVPRPIEADFDELGCLYVTDSSGSNDKVEKQLAEKPHRVVRLEDTDGDGRFDKSVVFADKMMFPEGAMWLDGSLYVSAPPSIWKLTDTNNYGVADVRVEWFKGKTLGGCANDLHGPYAGPDGWIYWCKGGFVKQTNTLANGKEFISRASHIFRARPDGTGLEPVMTGGMDNPVGLAFTPEGERIVSGTFFQNPEGGKRDGLIHALYGGVYGKVNDVLEGHPRTGDLLPIMTHLGAAAPAGLMRYESEGFGKDFQNNLFVACFNMHKIARCMMEPSGATYKTTDSDFLVSDNTDFHPTDVFEDADGSLLVVDTGGWYKLCCPTSQLQKPDVLGGIYRVRRKGAPNLQDPRGLKIDWTKLDSKALTKFLDDPRPAVASRAIQSLGKKGVESLDALSLALGFRRNGLGFGEAAPEPPSSLKRRNAIWALTRINDPRARAAIHARLNDSDQSVKHVALQSTSLWRDEANSIHLGEFLHAGQPEPLRRLAAEAIGRVRATNLAPSLLHTGIGDSLTVDRSFEHSLIYALLEIGDVDGVLRFGYGNGSDPALMIRDALIALDQMPGGNLKAEQVTPFLDSSYAPLKETAVWIAARHPDWSPSIARFLRESLRRSTTNANDGASWENLFVRFSDSREVRPLVTELLTAPNDPKDEKKLMILRAMARVNPKDDLLLWTSVLQQVLNESRGSVLVQAVSTARALSSPRTNSIGGNFLQYLRRISRDGDLPTQVRLDAIAALTKALQPVSDEDFEVLLGAVNSNRPISERNTATESLIRSKLTHDHQSRLVDSLTTVGPIELPKLLGAFDRATNENIGLALVASLEKSKSFASLRVETVKPHLTNFPAVVQQKADALLASLNTDAAQQKKHIDEMLAFVKSGDVRRGQAIFNSPKAACSACHAIGYLGGKIGPDLTRIGQIRNERDLLEAIVYPSASFVRSYEPMIVATKAGEEFSGVLRKDSAEEVILATGPATEQRLARTDITDMRLGNVSVMPSGLAEQLTKEEIADLLAFLRAAR